MKKSQLRNIIKESIKELMTEQVQTPPNSKNVSFYTCQGSVVGVIPSLTVNGQSPQLGDIIKVNFCNNPGGSPNVRTIFVFQINGPGDATQDPSMGINGHIDGTGSPNTFNPNATSNPTFCPNCVPGLMPGGGNHPQYIPPGGCHDVSPAGATPGCTAPPPPPPPPAAPCSDPSTQCDFTQWSNGPNWWSNWSTSGPFQNVNNNPNQPCNHICQKIQDWRATCQNAGPVQQNQLTCKLLAGTYAYNGNSCSTSNAPACQGLTI